MRHRISLDDQPLPAAMGVMPVFLVHPFRVVAEIDEVEPGIHIRRAVLGANFRRVARISEFAMVAPAAEGAFYTDHRRPLLRPRVRPRTLLLD